jgi:mannose-6-phosphate isomerase-like protein (cupin superfamily)
LSEQEIVCEDLNLALDDLRRKGFRLDVIYPADDPHSAVLSNGDSTIRLTTRPEAGEPTSALPAFQPGFVLTCAGNAASEGRAGMLYRDLIPDRLGGRYIASHITIPEGGPVADWVHFHRIAAQVLYVARGWVRVVYEGQGAPFVLNAGDLVLQPPEIRHRVLESSNGLEVVEIAAPALHATFADHEMRLPNGVSDPARDFSGQHFLRHIGSGTPWTIFNGGEARETGLLDATDGLIEARTVRPGASSTIDFSAHRGELVFGFVLDGSAVVDYRDPFTVGLGDAFVIPPDEPWRLSSMSADFSLLHVTTAQLD